MYGWLSHREWGSYVKETRRLGCLNRPHSFLRCSIVGGAEDGSNMAAIIKVNKQEWGDVLDEVVMPCFWDSTSLVSPYTLGDERMRQLQLGGKNPKRASAREWQGSMGEGGTWLENLVCVRLDKKGDYLREQLFTACVHPAIVEKVEARLHGMGNPKGVEVINYPKGVFRLQFMLKGVIVKVTDGAAWQDVVNAPSKEHKVVLHLYRLCQFMCKGYYNLEMSPLREPPHDQFMCCMHYCEAKPSGVCCAPWHAGFGTKQENALRGVDARKNRGRNKTRQLVNVAQRRTLGHPAP